MKTKVKVPWAKDKEDFIASIHGGEWVITADNELHLMTGYDDPIYVVRDRFLIYGRSLYHTTDWLRSYCEKHHPEIDFDTEFDSDQPGVFGRYQDKFGHDYEEWCGQEIFNRLKKELSEKGYSLPWE